MAIIKNKERTTTRNRERAWAGIEITYLDGDNYAQLEFRWVVLDEKPSHREYRLTSKLRGQLTTKVFDSPDEKQDGSNKDKAYDAYWDTEQKILAL